MNNLVPFNFENKTIRVVTDENGEPLFVGKDVCEALGYANANQAMASHCKGIQKLDTLQTKGGKQEMRVISEPDLMRLIVSSTLPSAQAFERKVFEDILPTIRKTGSYSVQQQPQTPLLPETRAVAIIKSYMDLGSLWKVPEHLLQIESVKEAKTITGFDFSPLLRLAPAQNNIPKADVMLEPIELGKVYKMSAIKMNQKLADLGLQVKVTAGWEPTEKANGMWSRHAWTVGTKSGYNLKWNASKVEELMTVTA